MSATDGSSTPESTADCLQRLETWFNKNLKGEQFEMLSNRVKFIPVHAMDAIVTRIIEESPPTPGRFPTVSRILQGWQIWRAENPERVMTHKRTDCDDCGGFGFLWFKLFDKEMQRVVEYVARCAACENWLSDTGRQSAIVFKRRAQLEAMGADIYDPSKVNKGPWPPPPGGVRRVAQKALKGFEL